MEKILMTKEQMIKEGYPYIVYWKDGKTYDQVFYTEKSCKLRIKELVRLGFDFKRIH